MRMLFSLILLIMFVGCEKATDSPQALEWWIKTKALPASEGFDCEQQAYLYEATMNDGQLNTKDAIYMAVIKTKSCPNGKSHAYIEWENLKTKQKGVALDNRSCGGA